MRHSSWHFRAPRALWLFAGVVSVPVHVPFFTAGLRRTCVSLGSPRNDSRAIIRGEWNGRLPTESWSRRFGRQRHPPPCSGDCVLSAGRLRSRHRWQPQQSQVRHYSDGPGYLDRTPTCTGSLSGPFRVRIEAWQRWSGVGQSFPGGPCSKQIQNVLWPKQNDDDAEFQDRETDCGCQWASSRKSESHSTKERSSTELRFASFPARLWSDWRGCQGSRWTPTSGALDSPTSYPRVDTARKRTSIRRTEYAENRQKRGCCRSSELPVVAPERS